MTDNGELKQARSLEELTDEVLKCHAFGHGWDPVVLPAVTFRGGTEHGRVECRCDCGTKRPEYIAEDGEAWGRSYNYLPNYKFTATKEDYRAEWYRRVRVRQAELDRKLKKNKSAASS